MHAEKKTKKKHLIIGDENLWCSDLRLKPLSKSIKVWWQAIEDSLWVLIDSNPVYQSMHAYIINYCKQVLFVSIFHAFKCGPTITVNSRYNLSLLSLIHFFLSEHTPYIIIYYIPDVGNNPHKDVSCQRVREQLRHRLQSLHDDLSLK